MEIIALDIGGTKISGGLFTPEGNKLLHQKKLLEGRTGDDVAELAVTMIRSMEEASGQDLSNFLIGLSIPGIAFKDSGSVWAPNIGKWDNYPLRGKLVSFLGIPEKNVIIDSDRACSILGEIWKGSATGCSNALFVAVGTGIGVGIYLNGRIIDGNGGITGAVGWMALELPYCEKFDACGCFEYYASGSGIGARAGEMAVSRPAYNGALRGRKPEEITAYDVFRLFPEGDEIAREVLDKAIQMWGMASANLVSLLNPEKIIWGGGIFGPAAVFLDRIYLEACKWAQPISIRQVKFAASALGEDAALFGAAKQCLNLEY